MLSGADHPFLKEYWGPSQGGDLKNNTVRIGKQKFTLTKFSVLFQNIKKNVPVSQQGSARFFSSKTHLIVRGSKHESSRTFYFHYSKWIYKSGDKCDTIHLHQ